jgi:hypothetical protein
MRKSKRLLIAAKSDMGRPVFKPNSLNQVHPQLGKPLLIVCADKA